MRSSTSNSDSDSRSRWRRTWILTASLVVLVIGAWEMVLRYGGFAPEYADNRALWMSARHRLTQPDPSMVAILGASRVQRAIDVGVLETQLQRPVVQLAVEGSSGMPVLENLAADPRFRGTVVISIAPAFSFNRRLSKLDAGNQAIWVRDYMQQPRSRRMEQEMRLGLQGLFAFRSPDAVVSRTIPELLQTGTFPGPDFKSTERNRFVRIYPERYETVVNQDTIVRMYRENTEAYEPQGFRELLQYFGTLVQILNAKGSRVFVLRLPSDGVVLDYEKQNFPKERFWQLMTNNIAARFIHFDDYPELAGYMSEDGSHVETELAADFTRQLSLVLQSNGL